MAEQPFKRIVRPATAEEQKRHAEIRSQVMAEFPPSQSADRPDAPPGIPAQIRAAREVQGLTWYALAQRACISDPNIVRDIELGRDTQLSNVQAVAAALGLRLELVEEHV
ncbi:helix-turn-helix domain-containing protein [Candidatus Entotheonella palauensis]|uniref:HTH cro/C1-type domain-containing protein n=1 Tax=Candidatus Entotheonella gemina TaxID=1429439 RepID=W4MDD8_9BACT|nr:helix-turn-helix transcriptional regulator [Candidatus Entotheonella palauensis]ETX07941.1 MAG: hypothetical protein ETSY2_08265 [Candidatus Entotheonella gemina]